ncbi:hypothetical protein ONZ45_g1886 [Pleurotus djamor]|nr:hypothetical protein ONZ45_g1886 [Pleurotus djamor]
MVKIPSRKTLENMRRADLQRLCKEYGVKANMKNEELIDLLSNINTPPLNEERPKAQPRTRRISTRLSSRAGPSRTSSMIIHELPEDEEEQEGEQEGSAPSPKVDQEPTVPSPPLESTPRTRKAKETQLRLGVGRPKLAGGSGARAVTKSIRVSRAKHGKSSRTVKPSEAPIPEAVEEPETVEGLHPTQAAASSSTDTPLEPPPSEPPIVSPTPVPASESLEELPKDPIPQAPTPAPELADADTGHISSAQLSQHIADAVQPLRQQLSTVLEELEQVKIQHASQIDALKSQIEALRNQFSEVQSQASNAVSTVQDLRESLKTPSNPRTPPPRSPRQEVPRAPHSISATTIAAIAGPSSRDTDPPSPSSSRTPRHDKSMLPHPGFTFTTLGKRHRDSTATNATGTIEEGEEEGLTEEELATKVMRPTKKRLRTTRHDVLTSDDPPSGPSGFSRSVSPLPIVFGEPRIPSFTVYQDPDPSDPPPPINHLPEYFEAPGPSRLPSTSSSHAVENHPFDFSFPFTSTPANPRLITPYPEATQSPMPPMVGRGGLHGRSGAFRSLGLGRPGDDQDSEGSYVDPAALTRRASERHRGSSSDRTTASSSETRPPQDPSKPTTMYGTELEGDTRFGEFGMEGVTGGQSSHNFWTGRF